MRGNFEAARPIGPKSMPAHPSASFTQPLPAKADVTEDFARLVTNGTTAWTYKATGKTIETPKVDVWRFRNGNAVAFFKYDDTALLCSAAS